MESNYTRNKENYKIKLYQRKGHLWNQTILEECKFIITDYTRRSQVYKKQIIPEENRFIK
jgi:hypothetical protein